MLHYILHNSLDHLILSCVTYVICTATKNYTIKPVNYAATNLLICSSRKKTCWTCKGLLISITNHNNNNCKSSLLSKTIKPYQTIVK